MRPRDKGFLLSLVTILCLLPRMAFASDSPEGGHNEIQDTLLFIGLIVLGAKAFGGVATKLRQVAVLGEISFGIALGIPMLLGYTALEFFKSSSIVSFVYELSVILLLFHAGLHSDLREMKEAGVRGTAVAVIGVIAPFLLGWLVVGPMLLPGEPSGVYLFIGATLTATSVGLTKTVFDALKITGLTQRIVLAAAVIDDILGLLILLVVRGIVENGQIEAIVVFKLIGLSAAFLVGSILVGTLLAPSVGRFFSWLDEGTSMKLAFAMAVCILYAKGSALIGLAPIVGAFAAGLFLDHVHFRQFADPDLAVELRAKISGWENTEDKKDVELALAHHSQHHVGHLVEGLNQWLLPVFFVMTGFQVNLSVLLDPKVVVLALALTAAAVVGKVVSGLVAGPGTNWLLVGIGMVPRGEVGFVFLNEGKRLGVMPDTLFAALMITILLTTIIPPILLPIVARRVQKPKTDLSLAV